MRPIAVIAALLVVSLIFAFVWRRPKQPREFKSTDEFVQWLADGAVKDAETNQHIKLDYSPESIKSVEEILGKLHGMYVQNPATISERGLSAAYGAYIGEVIRRSEPGVRWERDDEMGEKIYPLIWGTGHSYPIAWCHRRIVDGDGDNVWVKYSILKENKGILILKSKQ